MGVRDRRCPLRVKTGNAQDEHMVFGVPPKADINRINEHMS